MKSFRIFSAVVAVLFSFIFSTGLSAAIDSQAPVVKLRTSCQEGSITLDNCFTTMADLLNWTYGTRLPSASLPLFVDIGPGSFGGFTCNASGYITLRGAGRHNTVLGPTVVGLIGGGPGCTQLSFQDLSIVNNNGFAFQWNGSGSASHVNVELTGTIAAWWDITYANRSQHYWWNAVLNSTSNSGQSTFQVYGSVHRFYGGEVNLTAVGNGAQAVYVGNAGVPGELQMYGSAIRSKANPEATLSVLRGVQVDHGQAFHLHGGSIGVDATAAGNPNVSAEGIKGLTEIDDDGIPISTSTVHVLEAAYVLKPKGTGTASRVLGLAPGFQASVPFLWGNGPTPPTIISQKGADMFIETDCSSVGCQTAGAETHLLVYNGSCSGSGGPWFDVVTGACR
ncbi:MAG: hypothetical protein AB1560_05390 [Pseudomonadota bacterium]